MSEAQRACVYPMDDHLPLLSSPLLLYSNQALTQIAEVVADTVLCHIYGCDFSEWGAMLMHEEVREDRGRGGEGGGDDRVPSHK